LSPTKARSRLFGIDEAGLGPLLGPLVVAATGFAGPPDRSPWELLRRVVAKTRVAGRLHVADSKKVFAGRRDFDSLEATALSFLALHLETLPATVGELLARLGVDQTVLDRCPWYGDLRLPLPRAATAGQIELSRHLLRKEMERQDVELLLLHVRPVEVGEWNRWLGETGNKSDAHFRAFAELIQRTAGIAPPGAHLVVDRCGGRMRYAPALGRLFAGEEVAVLSEKVAVSSYQVQPRGLRITFAEKAEDRAFPVALASCLAKYLRELMVECINRWFQKRMPDLKETAGYTTDGRRFLVDVREVVEAPGFPRGLLVRAR
jgi:ribonuclease HII